MVDGLGQNRRALFQGRQIGACRRAVHQQAQLGPVGGNLPVQLFQPLDVGAKGGGPHCLSLVGVLHVAADFLDIGGGAFHVEGGPDKLGQLRKAGTVHIIGRVFAAPVQHHHVGHGKGMAGEVLRAVDVETLINPFQLVASCPRPGIHLFVVLKLHFQPFLFQLV